LCIGDLHIKVSNFANIDKLKTKVKALCEQHNFDFIVLLGDVLDTFGNIKSVEQNKAYDLVDYLREHCTVFVLVGNHDYINNQQFLTTHHGLNGMKHMANVYVIDTVQLFEMNDRKFVFTPYVPPGRFIEGLDTYGEEWREASVIFAHQEFYNCNYGMAKSIHGDKYDEELPLVISGHIHLSDVLQSNIIYTGTPMQHSFAESDTKYVWSFTIEDSGEIDMDKIDLELDEKRLLYWSVKQASEVDLRAPEVNRKNTIYKVDIKGTTEEIMAFKKGKKYNEILKHFHNRVNIHSVTEKTLSTVFQMDNELKKKPFVEILRDLIDKDSELVKESLEELLRGMN
jgi:DNA repair exonuclease SbcCD nuclease subunit